MKSGRNSVGYEIDPDYFRLAKRKTEDHNADLFSRAEIDFHE